MKVIVLGASPACPRKGGATSGYLVLHGETSLLVDCGTGVVANLQFYLDYHQLRSIVISHMHADHFFDLIPYRYGLKYAPYHEPWLPPALHLPPGGASIFEAVVAPFSENPDFFAGAFQVNEYDPAASLAVGDLTVRFARARHPMPAYAMRIEGGGRVFAYSSDTAPVENVVTLARDADLFFCESAIQCRSQDAPAGAHSTPGEAGEMARRAGVTRLVLTHVWPQFDERQMLDEASASFGAPVELAREHATYEV
jgi:ribonuclease BN (tRNA processing enzyme)